MLGRLLCPSQHLPSRRSMVLKFYAHSKSKRAIDLALVDSGATENFMSLQYTKYLQFPIQQLPRPQPVFNVNGTPNKMGEIHYYTNLDVQTGQNHTKFQFLLTGLGEHKALLGYPWMAAVQPCINWKKGWIDHAQLPVVFRAPNAHHARFLPRTNHQCMMRPAHQYFMGRVMVGEMREGPLNKIPLPY